MLLRYLGLAPARLERAVPAILALIFVVAVLIAGTVLRTQGALNFNSPRAVYFLYLLVLSVAVLLLVRWPRLSGAVLLLAILEFTLGALGHLVGGASLLPDNASAASRFSWHILLQATPKPGLDLVTANGKAFRHSAQGTRGRDVAAGKKIFAVFGGSSTYDVALGEGETWTDQLEKAIGANDLAVVNHGVPGYSTVEHVIQTVFYQQKFGQPACALYYVGWNDIRNAHIANIESAYGDFHLPSQVDSLHTRRIDVGQMSISPVLTLLQRSLSTHIDTVQYSPTFGGAARAGSDPALEKLYARNVRTISAVNRERGIKTVWIAQMLNRARLTGDGMYGWLPYVRDREVWPLQARFNEVLRDTAGSLGDVFVDAGVENFSAADFVDEGHFSAAGATKFAARLAPTIREACR